MTDAQATAAIAALTDWLLSPQSRGLPFEQTVVETCERIAQAGFSLWRARILLLTHHPEVLGLAFEWLKGSGGSVHPFPHQVVESPDYRGSPIEVAQTTGQRVRVRLEDPAEQARFRHVRSLIEQGATDYIAEPLLLGDGRVSCMTVATQRPGGFTEADIVLLERVASIVAFRLELRSVQHALESLLNTYLGPNAAKRVLRGGFRRGTGETMLAAIWYCDMRGFTALSDRLPAREVVALLDRFFEPIAAAVEGAGGEILKFIGDAALAVFPVENDDQRAACTRALGAAQEARRGVDALNALQQPGIAPVEMGVALHLGDVLYGNIGGRQRLDFTVIGAAVNEAVRLESLSKPLGVPLLMTARFAAACAGPDVATVSLGTHALRGVSAAGEVFTLADPTVVSGSGLL